MFVLEYGSLSRHCEPVEHIDSSINLSSHVPLFGKFKLKIFIAENVNQEKV